MCSGVAILSCTDREPGSSNSRGALSETTQADRLDKLGRTKSPNAVRMAPLRIPKDEGAIEVFMIKMDLSSSVHASFFGRIHDRHYGPNRQASDFKTSPA